MKLKQLQFYMQQNNMYNEIINKSRHTLMWNIYDINMYAIDGFPNHVRFLMLKVIQYKLSIIMATVILWYQTYHI